MIENAQKNERKYLSKLFDVLIWKGKKFSCLIFDWFDAGNVIYVDNSDEIWRYKKISLSES